MRRRFENILTKTGRLKKAFTPAVYFDTSVLVDYWSAEGLEVDAPSVLPSNEYNEFLREFLKAGKRCIQIRSIRSVRSNHDSAEIEEGDRRPSQAADASLAVDY